MKHAPLFLALLNAQAVNKAKREAQLLPAGQFKARDGRPGPGKYWQVNDAQGQDLAAKLTEIAAQTRFNFDYDHQTLNAAVNGQLAPASGWATKFEWRAGQGLFAVEVAWTAKAQALIDADEYAYISPVILFDDQGNVTGVLNAALVNTPALLGMESVVADAQARLSAALSQTHQTENTVTLLQMLIAALGLKADANETEALAALAALKTKAEAVPELPTALATALNLSTVTEAAALTAITALQDQVKTEQSTVQTIAALQAEVARLAAATQTSTVASTVDKAIADGKLLPAMRAWALGMGNKDIAQLNAYIQSAPVLNLGALQTGGKAPEGDDKNKAALSAIESDVASRLGITQDAFKQAAPTA